MRIATRGSELALWQAEHVAALLRGAGVVDDVELVVVSTGGDVDKASPLHSIGGKGIFVKEVQAAVLEGRAQAAVHSAKDLPAQTPEGLHIGAVPDRGDPRDALVGCVLGDLPQGARVATGSVRRRAQLARLRPDVEFHELRGNIATRLEKARHFDAIVVAAVALERLGLEPPTTDVLAVEQMLPQVGQGALAVECRADDAATRAALMSIDHPESRTRFRAERAFLRELGGDCSLPAGAYATFDDESGAVHLAAFLADEMLERCEHAERTSTDVEAAGAALARELRDRLGGG